MPVTEPADKTSAISVKAKSDNVNYMTYDLPTDSTHNTEFSDTVELDASEADREIDLALKCQTLQAFWIKVKSGGAVVEFAIERDGAANPPVMADSAQPITFTMSAWDSAETPPKIHLANPDAVNQIVVEIGGFGDFTNEPTP